MDKWEYLFVVHEDGYPRYVNGQELPNWKNGLSIFEYVNQLGGLGWELVAAPYTDGGHGMTYRLVFKRIKE